jgi:hypothetical protein
MLAPIKNPIDNGLKAWLAPGIIISLLVLASSFVGGYSGRQRAEGELQQRVLALEAEEKHHRDDMDHLGEKYITLREFRDRMDVLQEERRQADNRLLETMREIAGDVGRMRGAK